MTKDDWLKPLQERAQKLEEETKLIRAETERILKERNIKPHPIWDDPWSKLGHDEISDLHSILLFCKEKGYYEYLSKNISVVEVDMERLEKVLENIVNSD